jgi:hypothetical protein
MFDRHDPAADRDTVRATGEAALNRNSADAPAFLKVAES